MWGICQLSNTFQNFTRYYIMIISLNCRHDIYKMSNHLQKPSEAGIPLYRCLKMSHTCPSLFSLSFMILISMCFVYNKLNYNHLILLIYKLKFFVL